MDVEELQTIEMGVPFELDDGHWFCELLIRTAHGTLAIQMLADGRERFAIRAEPPVGDDF